VTRPVFFVNISLQVKAKAPRYFFSAMSGGWAFNSFFGETHFVSCNSHFNSLFQPEWWKI